MFYMKHKGKKLEVLEDNVYTICPQCGKEHVVDLHDILSCEHADLYGTSIYCEECSYERALKHPDEDWAQKVLAHHKGV